MARRAAKIDANQPAIVEALLGLEGVSVQSLAEVGDGCPDLVAGFRGHNILMEIKDGSLPPSEREFTSKQKTWHTRWRGTVHVVNSVAEALLVMSRYGATKRIIAA